MNVQSSISEGFDRYLLNPEAYDFRSIQIVAQDIDADRLVPAAGEENAAVYLVKISAKDQKDPKTLARFGNHNLASAFKSRLARYLDHHNEIAYAAMCIWEALLELRSKDEKRPICLAMDRTFERHGSCAMREAISNLAEACDSDWYAAYQTSEFDGDFDWEWCPNWLETKVRWDPTGEALPKLS